MVFVERPQACKGDAEPLSFQVPKRLHESGIRAHLLFTAPAGRLPSNPGREWTVDPGGNVHATRHDGVGTGEAREHAGGWNEFPVQAWWYYNKKEGNAPVDLSRKQLGELAWIIASVSKPMSPSGPAEEPCTWIQEDGRVVSLALRNFPLGDLTGLPVGAALHPPGCERLVDGVGATSTVDYFVRQSLPEEVAIDICANVAAGTMTDTTRVFEPLTKARAVCVSEAVGDTIGVKMGGEYGGGDNLTRPCEVCAELTTTGFVVYNKIRATATPAVREAIAALQEKRVKKTVERELDTWRALGLGHQEMTPQQREQFAAEQAKAASVAKTQQQNKDRGVRRARGGGGPSAECAASPPVLPKAPVQHDDRDGPAELRRHISDATRGADRSMLVCMRCAGPVIVAKARAFGRQWPGIYTR